MKKITMINFFACLVAIAIGFSAPSALAANKVLSLDGDGDYVEVLDNDSLDLTNTLTPEAWVLPYREFAAIIAKGDTIESYGLWVWHDFCVGFVHNYPEEGWWSASTTGKGNVWSHFAVSWNGQIVKFFLDGELIEEQEFSDTLILNNENLFIGADFPGGNDYLNGFIDEVRIWNVARTQEEIQDNMDKPLENPKSEPNLVGYWNFDGGTADDLSQYENDGELQGDAYIADVIYVSSEYGSPTGDGTKEHPYDTIQRGINEAGWKDIVQVLPGTYTENINLRSDLIVLGSGVENTTITAASGNIVTANNVHNVSFAGFTIDGQGSADNGILCSGTTSLLEISNNIIVGAIKGIVFKDSVTVSILSNIIRQNINYGILCDGFVNVGINNNVIDNNSDGIVCRSDATVSIIENTINRNTHNGIDSWNTVDLIIQNNTISENINAGAVFNDDSIVIVRLNSIQNNGHGLWCVENITATISDNLIHHNKMSGISMSSSKTTIIRNIIHHNVWFDIGCYEGSGLVIIGGNLTNANNFVASSGIKIQNYTPYTINATYNYWGTTNEDEIAAMMVNDGDGSIDFIPFINTLDEIVADTSGDGTVSAYDAALILQFVVGLIDTFPASIPKSPEQTTPCNYTISLPSLTAHAGKRIQVPVAINDANGLIAGGVILKYDPTVLKAVDVLPTTMLNGSYWKANTKFDGEIRFAFACTSASGDASYTTKTLFMVEFEVLPNTTGKISPLILDNVQFSENQSINKINGSVVVLPERSILLQNYPNPFNPETWIPYQLATDSLVMISIYNAKGNLIRLLHLGNQNAGIYMTKDKAAHWDGRDRAGEKVASGVYFYALQVEHQRNSDGYGTGKFISTRKMVIAK